MQIRCRWQKFTFKRILKPVASGTTTHYFFNDVRCDTKREYDEKVTSIIEAETFKLLTNPTYFLDLHWEKQREVLMEHCVRFRTTMLLKLM